MKIKQKRSFLFCNTEMIIIDNRMREMSAFFRENIYRKTIDILIFSLDLDLFVGIIIVTRDIIEKSCIPFGLGSIGCRLTSFIQVCPAFLLVFISRKIERKKKLFIEIK